MNTLNYHYSKLFGTITGDTGFTVFIAVLSRLCVFMVSWLLNYNFQIGKSFQTLLCSWDCGWYMRIVAIGYDMIPQGHPSGDAANWAFFPVFPMTAKGILLLTGLSGLEAATLISNVAFILALPILYSYLKNILDIESARFVVVVFSFSPYSLYFSAPYTESVYFLLMISSLYLATLRRWLIAGMLTAILSATRNAGVLLIFPLLFISLRQYNIKDLLRFSDESKPVLFCMAIAPLGLFLYMCYLYHHTGDALAFKNIQIAWGRSFQSPIGVWIRSFYKESYEMYCGIVACISVSAGVYLVWKRFMVEGIILLIAVVVPLTTGIAGIPRYALTSFPIYVALALLTKGYPRARCISLCCMLQLSGFIIMSWLTQRIYMQ
jgi:hypothetical protein